jgi:HlyD family secretion protein
MSAKKIIAIVAVVLVVALVITGTVIFNKSAGTAVATGKAVRQDLVSTVSGTGQIKPKTYVNIGATAFGRITHLYVKEGDHVKTGELLATVESQQPASAVAAQQATISASKTTVDSYIAAEKTASAAVEMAQADLVQKRYDIQRYEQLYKEQLVAKQDYDAKKAAFDVDVATLAQRQAALAQAKAQTASSRSQVAQAQATLSGNDYQLGLTQSRAPFDGLVTNVPVREGETVVLGIQNAEGSTLMTLADMSVITAEVKVDETDIVNVQLGQPADVSVDALPGKIFKGHVTEVGDQALLRTTGLATSQSTTGTEEAKDFKVVVTLDNPSDIPIQALVERDPVAEAAFYKNKGKVDANATAPAPGVKINLVQGVYLLSEDNNKHLRAHFVPVTTGVTGATDIEVLSGLKEGDEIVTGHYQVLRTLKSGTAVKRDNSIQPVATDTGS